MTTKNEARKSAAEVLSSVWHGEGYPVDPVAVARKLGVAVFTADLPDDVSGMLKKDVHSAPAIYLDTDEPTVRQRFTCAHEIGHYVRHTSEGDGPLAFVDYRGPRATAGTDLEEIFANEFAAALLMPEAKVRELEREGFGEVEMSQWFKVSLETAKWRLVNLGLARA